MKKLLLTSVAALIGTASTPLTAAETFKIDPKASKISFVIKNKPPRATEVQDVPGSFKDFSGTVVLDEANPAKSSVSIEVKTTSVDTGNAKRDDHLRNQDFFKVKEYPKMTFKSTKVSKDGDNYKIEGDFTLLAKTKKIEVTFEPSGEGGGTAKFQIKRSDYGMTYRVPDTADEVNVTLEMVGQKN